MSSSEALFKKACQYIPGGVNSPVRAFGFVGGTPPFIKKGEGAYLIDEDNNKFIDYVCTWGATILGHANPVILDAVRTYAQAGLAYGTPTKIEVELAEKICNLMPSIEMVRMVNSGTEATMSAIRLARGFTGRDKIIKFEGNYHGHSDSLLVKAGSGALTFGAPSSPGVPSDLTQHTLTATYNDLDSVQQIFEHYAKDIACIILEPITGNMNCILPQPGFLQGLRDLCDQYNSVLIIDEVMTGFRVALGGAQEMFNIKADLTTLGKVIGGGMPVGAFGGRRDIMEWLSPTGPVYQAGTLSGNPIAMASGLANLNEISKPGFFENLNTQTTKLITGLQERADIANIPFVTNSVCGMFGFFFTEEKTVTHYSQVKNSNVERFKHFYHGMLERGVFLAPSAYEAGFITGAHDDIVINDTLTKVEQTFEGLK